MNTLQRLLSNTFLAYVSNLIVKASSSLLFIFIGRRLGPAGAGMFNLGVTYFTIALALSAWGLHELLVREVAPRRDESAHYFFNYLVVRLALTLAGYMLLVFALRLLLPYSAETSSVVRILSLAIFPEAVFALCQALFVAHERLLMPTLAALVNSALKLGAGLWLLSDGQPVTTIAWVMPIGSALSLLVFIPGLAKLFRSGLDLERPRLDLPFIRNQLRYTPGFVLIGVFSTLDFQLDAFLISLLLGEADIGWYGAAQTIVLGFWMISVAVRTAIYPLMARYQRESPARLAELYRKASKFLILLALPMAAGISLLAGPIVELLYGASFSPTVPVLQSMIWSIVFAFLSVPNGRLILVRNHQRQAGWITGLSMVINLTLNLVFIPRLGIRGASLARVAASGGYFLLLYVYVQRHFLVASIWRMLWRPALATLVMACAVWPLREKLLLLPVAIGAIVYVAIVMLLGAVPADDRRFLKNLYSTTLQQ